MSDDVRYRFENEMFKTLGDLANFFLSKNFGLERADAVEVCEFIPCSVEIPCFDDHHEEIYYQLQDVDAELTALEKAIEVFNKACEEGGIGTFGLFPGYPMSDSEREQFKNLLESQEETKE